MVNEKVYHIKDNLSVCGFGGTGDRQQFERHGFQAHLQCAEGFDGWLKDCLDVKFLPFDDAVPIPLECLDEAQTWLSEHWDRGHKILVSCAAGESRSVAMAACLLTLKTEADFYLACEEVLSKVPGAYPHPSILVSAAAYCGQILDFDRLKNLYLKIPAQPPFPWTDDILKEALTNVKG